MIPQTVRLAVTIQTYDMRDDAQRRTLREAERCLHLTFGDAVTITLEKDSNVR